MSVAGILEATRSEYSPATRLIWICLENRANGARFWSMTHEAIAAELHLSEDTVDCGVSVLARDGIIRCVRHKRRPTTFYMLRTYPEGCARPRHEPEVQERIAPGSAPEIPPSKAELSPEFPGTSNPPDKYPSEQEGKERAAAPPPAPPPPVGDQNSRLKEAKEAHRRPAVSRLPDDWTPGADDREFARGRGLDPAEVMLAFVAYYLANGGVRADWSAAFRLWCARERRFDRRPSRAQGGAKPDRLDWLVARLERRQAMAAEGARP